MKILILDESGDHDLKNIDPNYPVFVLGGIIADQDYVFGAMEEKVRAFKRDLFGTEHILLHTADICRSKNGFECLRNAEFRSRFFTKLNQLMMDLQYSVVACAVNKSEHALQYGDNAMDPYQFSLHVLVERFCYDVGRGNPGAIIAESRNPKLDKELMLAFDTSAQTVQVI